MNSTFVRAKSRQHQTPEIGLSEEGVDLVMPLDLSLDFLHEVSAVADAPDVPSPTNRVGNNTRNHVEREMMQLPCCSGLPNTVGGCSAESP